VVVTVREALDSLLAGFDKLSDKLRAAVRELVRDERAANLKAELQGVFSELRPKRRDAKAATAWFENELRKVAADVQLALADETLAEVRRGWFDKFLRGTATAKEAATGTVQVLLRPEHGHMGADSVEDDALARVRSRLGRQYLRRVKPATVRKHVVDDERE
jgi:hypothetical protein